MRWQGQDESGNVEDRRGRGGFRSPGGVRTGGIGIGTIVIALIGSWLFGINPLAIIDMFGGGGGMMLQEPQQPQQRPPQPGAGGQSGQAQPGSGGDEARNFVSVVLRSTEEVWGKLFADSGGRYPAPKLVLYDGMTPTACGTGNSAAGPFYCPADQRVYIDLSFYRTLRDRLGATGDTAQAYVIAHEVGHHIQNLTGIMDKVQAARQRVSESDYNQLSMRLELQADCYAGIWANHTQQARRWFDTGDIEEALQAAAAVGDDNIQRRSQGVVVPESFTHGTSTQRVRWFRTGLEKGSVQQCDTFNSR